MHHNPDRAIAISANQLADGDAATITGPDLRADATIADANIAQLAQQFRAYGFDGHDLDRYCGAFAAPDPARVLAQWADGESRPRVRRVLVVSLCVLGEAR